MKPRVDDYIDGDVAYLLGLITARGTIIESQGVSQLIIEFPYTSLQVQGIGSTFDQETEIRLGLDEIRERLLELLSTDIKIVRKEHGVDFVIQFLRKNMIWRNILLLMGRKTSYMNFSVPDIFFESELPAEWKREFLRGFADVAGNIRHSNRYVDGRHRVRLDVLNYPTNWQMPVQLCNLLQIQLNVPVQLITWGHPNMGRAFREHQLNIFAKPFLKIGFTFHHKQRILDEFVQWDIKNTRDEPYKPCPGIRLIRKIKPPDEQEYNTERLSAHLIGHHYDAYWQICKALGCPIALNVTSSPEIDDEMMEE